MTTKKPRFSEPTGINVISVLQSPRRWDNPIGTLIEPYHFKMVGLALKPRQE
jgi:hypothetical protein